jgi:hypothetical protein
MEGPHPTPGLRVEGVDVSGRRLLAVGLILNRAADNHDVAGDGGASRREVRGADRVVDFDGQVRFAGAAERQIGLSRTRVHREQISVGGADEEPLPGAVGPVGEAALEETAVVRHAALVALRVVDPSRFAGARIECGNQAETGDRVHHAVDHERRFFVARGAP